MSTVMIRTNPYVDGTARADSWSIGQWRVATGGTNELCSDFVEIARTDDAVAAAGLCCYLNGGSQSNGWAQSTKINWL